MNSNTSFTGDFATASEDRSANPPMMGTAGGEFSGISANSPAVNTASSSTEPAARRVTKGNLWTVEEKLSVALQIVDQLKGRGKLVVKWDLIEIPGRTTRAISVIWPKIFAEFENPQENGGGNGMAGDAAEEAPAATSGRKRVADQAGRPTKKKRTSGIELHEENVADGSSPFASATSTRGMARTKPKTPTPRKAQATRMSGEQKEAALKQAEVVDAKEEAEEDLVRELPHDRFNRHDRHDDEDDDYAASYGGQSMMA